MDSGLGGLSVARVLQRTLPHEDLIFVGDQGHFPYGVRSQESVRRLSLAIGDFLEKQDAKMMVIACNTATAAALPALQAQLSIPVIGMINPGVKAALALPGLKRVGVIATTGTIKAGAYQAALKQAAPTLAVTAAAPQALVSIVEGHQTGTAATQEAVDRELAAFKEQPVDALILGCTHYPFLAEVIADEAIEPISRLKTAQLGSRNPRLHPDETLIALSITSATSEVAARVLAGLPKLRGCDAFFSVIISSTDEALLKKLGINVCCEPKYERHTFYHR